jgi:tetratricopeptide (TPR) repeat protein
MERHYIIPAFILISISFFSLCGCGFKEPVFEVLDGNYRYLRGDYTGATISYIKALEKKVFREWISYNLGNVYNALGETDVAIEELLDATSGQESELLFRAHFNIGNIYFELGNYEKAVYHFRNSLLAKQNSIDAKINLELAIEKMEKENALDKRQEQRFEKSNVMVTEELNTILEYAQQKEAAVWKLIKETEEEEEAEEDW